MIANRTTVQLDGASLTIAHLRLISQRTCDIVIPQAVYESVNKANDTLDQRLKNKDIVYGVNTGFGENSTKIISNNDLQELQMNLLRSHACGVGELVSHSIVRVMIALRINSLVRGHSGVTTQTLHTLLDALTKDCLPPVPSQGSVGASGDLCPLAHLVLPFTRTPNLQLWDPIKESYEPAEQVMTEFKIIPLDLKRKEGLALINGTQFMTSNAAEALFIAKNAWRHSILAASLSCAALQAVPAAFDDRIHQLRPHEGQIGTAKAVRNIVFTETTTSLNTDIQDPYSIRCIPQILGPFVEISTLVEKLLSTEINSVTDNPLIFSEDQTVLSGGNFHGQYPAKASDMLAMVIPDMCNVAERRIARLVDHSLSKLPGFLIPEAKCGLHSGMMIPAYTAAALCSETKCLAHPSSVDTIPTCANKEDHVSMGAYAARKAIKAATNAEVVVAIELLVAAQALDLLIQTKQVQPSGPVERIRKVVRECVPFLDGDRYLKADIDAVVNLVRSGRLTNGFEFPI